MFFRNMSPLETTGNSPAAFTQHFSGDASLHLGITVSAFLRPHPPTPGRCAFSRLDYGFARDTTCCFLSPPVGADQTCVRLTRTFTSALPTVCSPAPSPDI